MYIITNIGKKDKIYLLLITFLGIETSNVNEHLNLYIFLESLHN